MNATHNGIEQARQIMTIEVGHASFLRRIAINVGAGYVPGMNAVIMGAALAAGKLGWEMVGIRDGFDGLLHPDRYPDGGLVTLNPQLIENLDPAGGGILGQSVRVDPFHVRHVNEDDMVEEVDDVRSAVESAEGSRD